MLRMALTNAERHARWRARHRQEVADLKAAKAAPEKLEPRALPAQLPPGVTKARNNQEVGRDAQGHRLERQPPARRQVPDLEAAKKAFSDRMRIARIAARLSQAEVAVALFGTDFDGTYRKRYINWEIGRSFMTQNVIPVFAELVGVDCNYLFGCEVNAVTELRDRIDALTKDGEFNIDGGEYGEKR